MLLYSPKLKKKKSLREIWCHNTFVSSVSYLLIEALWFTSTCTFHPYSMAHVRITSYRALVAKKQYPVIFEIYIMKRCCFSLWNKYVARLTAMETGWAVCSVSFSVSQYSQPCYLIKTFKNVRCLFSCCQYAKTAKKVYCANSIQPFL